MVTDTSVQYSNGETLNIISEKSWLPCLSKNYSKFKVKVILTIKIIHVILNKVISCSLNSRYEYVIAMYVVYMY